MIIYKTTNLINNKIYIGQHNGTKSSYVGSGKILKYAINKYGRENFIKEIIIEGIFTQLELDSLERYYIKFYNSNNNEIGYNITLGGLGSTGIKHTKETLIKMSNAKKGVKKKPFTKEHINNLRLAKLGTKQSKETILKRSVAISKSLTGIRLSPEHIESLRTSHIGYEMPEEQKNKISKSNTNNPKNSKIILCYTTNGDFVKEYPSIAQAHRDTGTYSGNICNCLKGIVKTSGGYVWKYK